MFPVPSLPTHNHRHPKLVSSRDRTHSLCAGFGRRGLGLSLEFPGYSKGLLAKVLCGSLQARCGVELGFVLQRSIVCTSWWEQFVRLQVSFGGGRALPMAREAATANEQALLWAIQGAAMHQPDSDSDEEDLIQEILVFAWQQSGLGAEGLGLEGAAASVQGCRRLGRQGEGYALASR